jgi:hypothetical protein
MVKRLIVMARRSMLRSKSIIILLPDLLPVCYVEEAAVHA